MTGEFPRHKVDHRDTIRHHNWWGNLREATIAQNSMNVSISKRNTSGIKGVCWVKRRDKWQVTVKKNGKTHYAGMFESKEDATEAVRLKRLELHGEFTNHG